jgi:hypothetical protein
MGKNESKSISTPPNSKSKHEHVRQISTPSKAEQAPVEPQNNYQHLSVLNNNARKSTVLDLSGEVSPPIVIVPSSPTKAPTKSPTKVVPQVQLTPAEKAYQRGDLLKTVELLIDEHKSHDIKIIFHKECFDKVQIDYDSVKQLAYKFSKFDACSNHSLTRAMDNFRAMEMGSKRRCVFYLDPAGTTIVVVQYGLHDTCYRFGGSHLNGIMAEKYWKRVNESLSNLKL